MRKKRNGLPSHCSLFYDRHNKPRIRFRKLGFSTYLPYPPQGEEFENAYCAALKGLHEATENIGKNKTRHGSFSALCVAYYRTAEFTGLAEATKTTYRGIIERFRLKHGDKIVKDLKREHIRAIIGSMADRKQAANNLLSLLKIMLDLAMDYGWIQSNPARGVKSYPKKTEGFHSWTDEQIEAFESRHASGTKARLAFSLLFYTAQRRGDVIRFGWRHLDDENLLQITQNKTGTNLKLPLHPNLKHELDLSAKGNMTFLVTEYGAPFTAAGFGNWFRDRCREAGLTECSAHGLRKAAARRMAEAGVSADVIRSVTGHTNLRTVSIYTNAANQVHLAIMGIDAIDGGKNNNHLSNQLKKLDKKGDK